MRPSRDYGADLQLARQAHETMPGSYDESRASLSDGKRSIICPRIGFAKGGHLEIVTVQEIQGPL